MGEQTAGFAEESRALSQLQDNISKVLAIHQREFATQSDFESAIVFKKKREAFQSDSEVRLLWRFLVSSFIATFTCFCDAIPCCAIALQRDLRESASRLSAQEAAMEAELIAKAEQEQKALLLQIDSAVKNFKLRLRPKLVEARKQVEKHAAKEEYEEAQALVEWLRIQEAAEGAKQHNQLLKEFEQKKQEQEEKRVAERKHLQQRIEKLRLAEKQTVENLTTYAAQKAQTHLLAVHKQITTDLATLLPLLKVLPSKSPITMLKHAAFDGEVKRTTNGAVLQNVHLLVKTKNGFINENDKKAIKESQNIFNNTQPASVTRKSSTHKVVNNAPLPYGTTKKNGASLKKTVFSTAAETKNISKLAPPLLNIYLALPRNRTADPLNLMLPIVQQILLEPTEHQLKQDLFAIIHYKFTEILNYIFSFKKITS